MIVRLQIDAIFQQLRDLTNQTVRLRAPRIYQGFLFERDLDRDVPQLEREREYPNQYDEPEVQRDPEYPFQDFNYGP